MGMETDLNKKKYLNLGLFFYAFLLDICSVIRMPDIAVSK